MISTLRSRDLSVEPLVRQVEPADALVVEVGQRAALEACSARVRFVDPRVEFVNLRVMLFDLRSELRARFRPALSRMGEGGRGVRAAAHHHAEYEKTYT